jgi:hypothetical protein
MCGSAGSRMYLLDAVFQRLVHFLRHLSLQQNLLVRSIVITEKPQEPENPFFISNNGSTATSFYFK